MSEKKVEGQVEEVAGVVHEQLERASANKDYKDFDEFDFDYSETSERDTHPTNLIANSTAATYEAEANRYATYVLDYAKARDEAERKVVEAALKAAGPNTLARPSGPRKVIE